MDGGHRPIVARVHRLKHVDNLFTTGLTHDDTVRTHPQCVAQTVTLGHSTLAFDVWRAGFHAAHMGLLQLKFGGVFDRQNTFAVVDEGR